MRRRDFLRWGFGALLAAQFGVRELRPSKPVTVAEELEAPDELGLSDHQRAFVEYMEGALREEMRRQRVLLDRMAGLEPAPGRHFTTEIQWQNPSA